MKYKDNEQIPGWLKAIADKHKKAFLDFINTRHEELNTIEEEQILKNAINEVATRGMTEEEFQEFIKHFREP